MCFEMSPASFDLRFKKVSGSTIRLNALPLWVIGRNNKVPAIEALHNENYDKAISAARKAIDLYPEYTEEDSPLSHPCCSMGTI